MRPVRPIFGTARHGLHGTHAVGGNSGRSSQVHRAQSDSECRAAPLRRTTFVAVGTTVSGVEWLAVHADDEPRAIDNRADPVMRGAVRFRLNGTDYELSGAAVRAAAARGTPEPLLEHWVAAGGRRWPPKQLFEDATGIPRAKFTSHIALRQLRRLGLTTSPLPGETATAVLSSASPRVTSHAVAELAVDGPPLDLEEVGRAFAALVAFLSSEDFTARVAHLEHTLAGADRPATVSAADAAD